MKSIFLSILLIVAIEAQTLKYKVYSPLVGKLGKITLTVNEMGKSYKMVGEAKTSGIAKMLTHKRRDKYISVGKIKNGRYFTQKFRIERKDKKYKEIVDYIFDYKHHKIIKHKQRWKKGKKDKDSKETLKYFATTDLAALFHNIMLDLKSGRRDYLAAGAEKIKGKVTVEIPPASVANKEKKMLKVPNNLKIIHVISKEEIEGKRNRKVIFAVDKNGIIHKGYFEAIPVVGKIYVELRR